jgi:hypothetical protein
MSIQKRAQRLSLKLDFYRPIQKITTDYIHLLDESSAHLYCVACMLRKSVSRVENKIHFSFYLFVFMVYLTAKLMAHMKYSQMIG